ncbi:stage IV sporulation protein A [Viridibacillus arvi]|uniref:stage IV sporulation protein A n=1 Tax=Viridibacillus arvi TaxID=263475 RepID=UPI000AB87634|nr:stage IV sporulation protein A [Viridibacillus arvi]
MRRIGGIHISEQLYEQIVERTNGDVYIGVVGPVRVGKSTFTKRVMEVMVLPNITDEAERLRAQDELPQSSPGPVIMTAEPKFVPAKGTQIAVGEGPLTMQIRLADCVGYIIDGVKGYEDENGPKLVHTPWHNEPIPFQEAARIGTDKVIRDHSNIGIVVTTDGSVNGIPRQAAEKAEIEIIEQLQSIGKPFVVVINSKMPAHKDTVALKNELSDRYQVPVISTSADQMSVQEVNEILKEALYEFPITSIEVERPDWMEVIGETNPINVSLNDAITTWSDSVTKIRDVKHIATKLSEEDYISNAEVTDVNPGMGSARITLQVKNDIYQAICEQFLDEPVVTKKEWLLFIKESQEARQAHKRFHEAIEKAKKDGYGVTLPNTQELEPSPPEIIKQNNFFGVRMKANAPSYHIIRIDMEAEFAPLIGSEFHSQQLLKDLKHGYYHDRDALWNTQLFGTPLYEVMKESIAYKTNAVPAHAKTRMRQTIERMVNQGDRGMVTFIL